MKSGAKILVVIIAITCWGQSVKAQQDAEYSQYLFNTLVINPAYAGSRNVISATALYRDQWVGIPGAPQTTTLSIDAPIDSKKIGLGLQIFNDRIGITNTTGAYASYAFRIRMESGTLAFGIQGGVSQYRADFTSVDLGSDNSVDYAFSNNINKMLLNFGVGVYYSTDKFFIGLSTPQMLNNQFTNLKVQGDNTLTGQAIHLFLTSGYVFELNEDLHFNPSVLLQEVQGSPIEGDINGILWIKDVLAVGVQYRTAADIVGLLQVQVTPQIRIGYSYDHSTSNLVQYNSGTHEIMLRYEFGYSKGKILSPRYF